MNDISKLSRSPLPHLAALNCERPRSKMGQVRWRADGIDIPYNRLSEYIGRIRRRERAHSSVVPTPGTAAETSRNVVVTAPATGATNSGTVTWDPAANLRERLGKNTGFDFRGTGRREDLI
jgi:hypothetical protein